ncbi:nucleotidyltransferase domain-containing protein [Streptomyces sp. JW3]|uniref:nucleotidyltransferase domain-containing protein n=1 Tax=Streptomyces sp. JW3 TaxID=3456955 RepID=UPI003FA490BE
MKRERATAVLCEMLDRLEQSAWPLNLVEEIFLFGSYIRGALEVGDVDIVVQHTADERWKRESLDAMFGGRDGYAVMRQALRGRRRGVSFQFQDRSALEEEGIELFLLWRRGEPIDLARQRLTAISPDPAAGRAPRDHVLPAYEAIADQIPRPVRIDLHRLCTSGGATVSAFPLLEAQPHSAEALTHVDERWTPHSPLRRGAAAALAHLENLGQALDHVELHGQYLDYSKTDEVIECFIDLGWRYWRSANRYLDDGQAWFEVLPATVRQPLHALYITPGSRR